MIASCNVAGTVRTYGDNISLDEYEYLDVMGLFETGWMVFDHLNHPANYGYPRDYDE